MVASSSDQNGIIQVELVSLPSPEIIFVRHQPETPLIYHASAEMKEKGGVGIWTVEIFYKYYFPLQVRMIK